jgi:hypothetical protein
MARALKDGEKPAAAAGKAPVQDKKSFSIGTLKQNMGLANAAKMKPIEYMKLEGAIPGTYPLYEATGIYGPPLGFLSRVQGHSDTGKSSLVNAIIVYCQKNGILPVICDTEGNFSFYHAQEGGMQIEWVEDEEGEVHPTGQFLYINNYSLFQMVGKARAKGKRSVATLEDLATFCYDIIDQQTQGKIPMPVCIIWDALGTLGCDQTIEGKNFNAMWDAAAVKQCFRDFWFQVIPNSRMMESPYTNSMVVVAKIRHDMSTGGMGSTELQGGKVLAQSSRMAFQLGNSMSAGTRAKVASFNKVDTRWGILSKVKVVKNHVEGASYEGTLIATAHGFITEAQEDEYKRRFKNEILKKLEVDDTNAELQFTEEELP